MLCVQLKGYHIPPLSQVEFLYNSLRRFHWVNVAVFIQGEVNIFHFLLVYENFDPLLFRSCGMMTETYEERSGVEMTRVPSHNHDVTRSFNKGGLIEGAKEKF